MGDETRVQMREAKKGAEAIGNILERYVLNERRLPCSGLFSLAAHFETYVCKRRPGRCLS